MNSLEAGQTHPLVAAVIPPHYNVCMCIDVSQVNSQYALERQMGHIQQRVEKVTLKILSLDESMIQIYCSPDFGAPKFIARVLLDCSLLPWSQISFSFH